MIFLIRYNRQKGELIECRPFPDEQRELAWKIRLELELEAAAQGLDREIVLLHAASEEHIRRTHGRCFKTLGELVSAPLPIKPSSTEESR